MKEREYILYMYRPDDPRANQLKGLEQADNEEQPNEPQTMSELKPVPLEHLAGYADKQPIPCVEGKLITLYKLETHNKTTKAPLPFPKRDGVIQQGGLEHRICFDEKCNVPDEYKGKFIRITSSTAKGMTGIKMDRYSPNAKYHKISVTPSATIEVVGSNGQPSQPPTTSAQPQSTEQAKPANRMNDETQCKSNAQERLAHYRALFNLTCETFGHDPEEVVKKLSPSDLKEITTGMSMTFRGQYGVYQHPIFGEDAGLTQAKANMEAQLGKSAEVTKQLKEMYEPQTGATASPTKTTTGSDKPSAGSAKPSVGKEPAWKSAPHRESTLGEYEKTNPKKLASLIQWAHDKEGEELTPEATALRTALLEADEDLSMPSRVRLGKALASAGLGTEFEEEDVEAAVAKRLQMSFGELNYTAVVGLGNKEDFPGFVEECKEAANARKAPAASGPKKAAKKPAADDSDMPD